MCCIERNFIELPRLLVSSIRSPRFIVPPPGRTLHLPLRPPVAGHSLHLHSLMDAAFSGKVALCANPPVTPLVALRFKPKAKPCVRSLHCELRLFVFRSALFVLVLALVSASAVIPAQSSSPSPAAPSSPASAPAETSPPVPDQVSAAEAAIASSDWKTAEAKLGRLIPLIRS